MPIFKSRIKYIFAAILLIVIIFITNYSRLTLPASSVADDDMSVISYYRYGVVPDVIVYDILDVGLSASQAGVIGGFFRYAEKLKDRDFSKVILSYRGSPKFFLRGEYFKQIGLELSYQNPIYTLRTFPEKLETPDGVRAFDTWTGGALGVLNAQLEDVNEMGRQWYLYDMAK